LARLAGFSSACKYVAEAVDAIIVCADYAALPCAAIGNGRVHYSTTSALPATLLSSRRPRLDVASCYTRDALPTPAFFDRRDLSSSYQQHDRLSSAAAAPASPDSDYSPAVELPPSRLRFIHTLGRGLFGDVSNIVPVTSTSIH